MSKKQEGADLQEFRMRFVNSGEKRIAFVLEPWGDVYEFDPSDEFVVIFRGPPNDIPEIDVSEASITAYGWTGSYASILKNGNEIRSGLPKRRIAGANKNH